MKMIRNMACALLLAGVSVPSVFAAECEVNVMTLPVEQVNSIPDEINEQLMTRLTRALTNTGIAAGPDFCQFFVTGKFTDYYSAGMAPCAEHFFGTDNFGRDIFTRVVFAFQSALFMAIMVLAISVPFGVLLGLFAGFMKGTIVDTLIMRITDVFLAVPPMLLALAIASVLEPNLKNSMLAVTVMWWPWYTRLVYGMATSCSNENYVISADLTGASKTHIIFKEILPNCVSSIMTKVALDVGWVIMIDASLSYVGLGAQPPTPSLGQMISDGARYMPDMWWMIVFPSLAIVLIICGFNFLGDGLQDMLSKGGKQND